MSVLCSTPRFARVLTAFRYCRCDNTSSDATPKSTRQATSSTPTFLIFLTVSRQVSGVPKSALVSKYLSNEKSSMASLSSSERFAAASEISEAARL